MFLPSCRCWKARRKTATRDAIASTKENELLGQTGDRFELTLLLTQTEALSYAWHLAAVASLNEPQPDCARALLASVWTWTNCITKCSRCCWRKQGHRPRTHRRQT